MFLPNKDGKATLCDIEDAVKSANICKSDLASEMVYEFPSFRCYGQILRLSRYSQDVAKVCEEHYVLRPNDPVPGFNIRRGCSC